MTNDNGLAEALAKEAKRQEIMEKYRKSVREQISTSMAGLKPALEEILHDETVSRDLRDVIAALTVANAQTAMLLGNQITNLTGLVIGLVPEERRKVSQKGLEDMAAISSVEIQKYIDTLDV